MQRISINNFMGGMVDAKDPTEIPENACVLMENYEYTDGQYPRKRMGVVPSEIADPEMPWGFIRNIDVWNPRKLPADCIGDKVYVVVTSNKVYLAYSSSEDSVIKQVHVKDIPDDSELSIFCTPERILFSSNKENGWFISTNKDGEIYSGQIALEAPIYPVTISGAGADNLYAAVEEDNHGMSVERGNILQYCYTVEDKYGAESNPSPIKSQTKMSYKYPSAELPGYKYYWFSTVISGLTCRQYPQEVRDRLKYYNVYRRDIDFREGVISTQFVLVRRVPVGGSETTSFTDTSSMNLQDISYDNNLAPVSRGIIDVSGVIFMSGVSTTNMKFPFKFDRYIEISINNDNNTDYVCPIIPISISYDLIGSDYLTFLGDYMNKYRLFFSDMQTPIPLMFRHIINEIHCYIKVPYLDRESTTKLYLCIADESPGVDDPVWNSFDHGLFFNFWVDDWDSQPIFDINRPLNTNHLVCTNVPYGFGSIPSRNSLFNLADMSSPGMVQTISGVTSEYVPGVNNHLTILPYSQDWRKPLSDRSYEIELRRRVRYDLLKTPALPVLLYYEGEYRARGWVNVSNNTPYNVLIHWGNLRIVAVYLASNDYVAFYLWRPNNTRTDLFQVPSVGAPSGSLITLRLLMYVNSGGDVTLRYYAKVQGNSAAQSQNLIVPNSGGTLDLGKVLYLNKNMTGDSSHYNNQTGIWTVSRFDVMQVPSLGADEVSLLFYSVSAGATFFRSPVGAISYNAFANANITFEKKEIITEDGKNALVWSNITGNAFPALNSKLFREPINGMVSAPSYMKMQYQNTIVVFTRNTVNRIVLSDDLNSMGASMTNEIEEFSSGGLFAKDSLATGGGSIFWLSENGVMRWSPDGLMNISYGIINIPIHQDYIGVWIGVRGQYLLHDRKSRKSYVFHDLMKVWTLFTGLLIDKYAKIDFGESTNNTILILQPGNGLIEYPSLEEDDVNLNCDFKIHTRRFELDNHRLVRYRMKYAGADSVQVRISNNIIKPVLHTEEHPPNFRWIMLPTNMWGETLQFYLDNPVAIRSIDIDLKEGV